MANVACIEELKNAILDFDEDAAVTSAEKIIKEGASPMDAIDAMGDALKILGDKFQIMEVFLPEILLATDAFKAGLKVLEPELMKTIDAGSFQEKPKSSSAPSRVTCMLWVRIWSPPCSPWVALT